MKKRVSIINDSKFESRILRDSLDRLGYEVEIGSESHVLEHLSYFQPDIVIVNFIMKEMRGDLLIHKIKRKFPQVKCILSSCNPIDRSLLGTAKVDAILQTPVDLQQLASVLEKFKDSSLCANCSKPMLEDFILCPYCGQKT